jgi:hypothetical protein
MHIFLDDERVPGHVSWVAIPRANWTIVRSYEEFVELIKSAEHIEFVSFDHDLGYEHYGHGLNGDIIPYDSYAEKTGMHCAKALIDWCLDRGKLLPEFEVHSLNPVGRDNIRNILNRFRSTQ